MRARQAFRRLSVVRPPCCTDGAQFILARDARGGDLGSITIRKRGISA
jgi:hypothetical protein